MWVKRRALRRALVWVVPLVVALPPLFWVVDGSYRASLTPLGRDQGIFQYVAWAIRHGAVAYRDVRDVNGPLVYLLHLLFLALGGEDERRFRLFDLVISGAVFAFVGACIAGVGKRLPRTGLLPRAPTGASRVAWAFAAWVILTAQYLLYLYWDLAQRESFADWFVFAAFGLQLVAQSEFRTKDDPRRDAPRSSASRRRMLVLVAVSAGLGSTAWFAKPTFLVFSALQAAVLLAEPDARASVGRRLGAFAVGTIAGCVVPLIFLFGWGDAAAFFRITFHDVPAMYRFIWPKGAVEILSRDGVVMSVALAAVTSTMLVALVVEGELPRRLLGIALLPVAGMVSVLAQAKGFPYHFHPVTLGMHLQWVVIVVWLANKYAWQPRRRGLARFLPHAVAAALALKAAASMAGSPHITNIWILEKGSTAEKRADHDFLVYFRAFDFFPWELHQTARWLRENTDPTDTVQTYGMDPYVLFLAGRMSATPYIYAYDLNVDAALSGGFTRYPNDAESEVIKGMRDAHEKDLLARVREKRPAAFVFFDKAPLTGYPDSFQDFEAHCAETAAWVRANYREVVRFEEDHVWLRNDLTPRTSPRPSDD